MADTRAMEFVKWLADNPDKRDALLAGDPATKRKMMQDGGFGDVSGQDAARALESASAGDLSDEQLQSIQGGLQRAAIIWD